MEGEVQIGIAEVGGAAGRGACKADLHAVGTKRRHTMPCMRAAATGISFEVTGHGRSCLQIDRIDGDVSTSGVEECGQQCARACGKDRAELRWFEVLETRGEIAGGKVEPLAGDDQGGVYAR